MQSALFRIRTRVAVSISYDDNHYTTGTGVILFRKVKESYILYVYMYVFVQLVLKKVFLHTDTGIIN